MAEKEYIEREAVINALNDIGGYNGSSEVWSDGWNEAINEAINVIKNIPAADVAPVRHGRWVKEKRDVLIHWHCSACRECYFLDVPNAKYCPHCGCKMDMDGG